MQPNRQRSASLRHLRRTDVLAGGCNTEEAVQRERMHMPPWTPWFAGEIVCTADGKRLVHAINFEAPIHTHQFRANMLDTWERRSGTVVDLANKADTANLTAYRSAQKHYHDLQSRLASAIAFSIPFVSFHQPRKRMQQMQCAAAVDMWLPLCHRGSRS